MALTTTVRPAYTRRPVPAQYDAGFFLTEFGKVAQNALLTAAGTFTLAAAATTTVTDPRVGGSSVILLMPTNASAATLMQSTKALYVSARTDVTSFVVRTADGTNAAGTETFGYVIVG